MRKIWVNRVECNVMMPIFPATAPIRGRFAPSPTGLLHPGSLVAALGSWLWAKHQGGQWWLRIEDVDRLRCIADADHAQIALLAAFGLVPDGEVVWQSQRDALYQAALDRLIRQGDAFECHCSRRDLVASGGIHRQCRPHARRPDPAWRLRVPEGCEIAFTDAVHGALRQRLDRDVGDFVLRRSDGFWAYQLAVVVDDAAQGMSEVVRGADLLDSTPRQIFLQQRLGLATPAYAHLPLVLDENGRKLGKSLAALPLAADAPLPALRWAWQVLGQTPEAIADASDARHFLALACPAFAPQRVPKSAAALHNRIFTNSP